MISVELIEKILNHITPVFMSSIKLDALMPFLLEHKLLTDAELKESILCILSTVQKTENILQCFRNKGHGMLQKFLCCLNQESTHLKHADIATELRDKMKDYDFVYQEICLECKLKGIKVPSHEKNVHVAGKFVIKINICIRTW